MHEPTAAKTVTKRSEPVETNIGMGTANTSSAKDAAGKLCSQINKMHRTADWNAKSASLLGIHQAREGWGYVIAGCESCNSSLQMHASVVIAPKWTEMSVTV
jgi:hypothetical protein